MTENKIANFSVNYEFLGLIGAKLYTMHPLILTVRELLQNGRDAGIKKGLKNSSIEITLYCDKDKTVVHCKDNGIGMSDDDILNNFLCLGSSTKNTSIGETGGFGIAKAVFFCNESWTLHSHDNYLDDKYVRESLPISKVEYLDGTEVTVTVNKRTYSQIITDVMATIILSDVNVIFKVFTRETPSDEWSSVVDVNTKNIRDFKWTELAELTEKQDDLPYWKMKGALDVSFPSFRLNGYQQGGDVNGQVYVRVNGLIQFRLSAYSSYNGMKGSFIVDIMNPGDPRGETYPLTMSRETFKGEFARELFSVIEKYFANPITTNKMVLGKQTKIAIIRGRNINDVLPSEDKVNDDFVERIPKPSLSINAPQQDRDIMLFEETTGVSVETVARATQLSIQQVEQAMILVINKDEENGVDEVIDDELNADNDLDGKSLEISEVKDDDFHIYKPTMKSKMVSKLTAAIETLFKIEVDEYRFESVQDSIVKVSVLLKDYKRKNLPQKDWKLLAAWGEILKILMPWQKFSIGLTGGTEKSVRLNYRNELYFLINPYEVNEICGGKMAQIFYMFTLAVHEVSHNAYPSHGEDLTSEMDSFFAKSMQFFVKNQKRILMVMKGKNPPSWFDIEEVFSV